MVATWVSWIPDILNTPRRRKVWLSGHVGTFMLLIFGKLADVFVRGVRAWRWQLAAPGPDHLG
jgi:hypothetical protein